MYERKTEKYNEWDEKDMQKENIEENTKGRRCKGNAQKKMAEVC